MYNKSVVQDHFLSYFFVCKLIIHQKALYDIFYGKVVKWCKRKINAICKALTLETKKYDPQKTVENINAYIASPNKLDRILYSEISNYVFSLEMAQRGIFATNLEKLLLYSLDENNNVAEDSKKLIVKIYDHFQLALHQIENVNNIFANSIKEAKENLQKEIKSVEKEYISILGIFAAIVLAFVGGITFSTSVLQNISMVSIFRLLLVIDFLAFILINTIYILVKFIFTINEKNTNFFNVKALNTACLVQRFFDAHILSRLFLTSIFPVKCFGC